VSASNAVLTFGVMAYQLRVMLNMPLIDAGGLAAELQHYVAGDHVGGIFLPPKARKLLNVKDSMTGFVQRDASDRANDGFGAGHAWKQAPPRPVGSRTLPKLVRRDGGDCFDPIQHLVAEVHGLNGVIIEGVDHATRAGLEGQRLLQFQR
jgi:hypothetical protein